MSSKNDYTAEEWDLLKRAALEAGAVMVALEPGGMVRESLAVFKALDESAVTYADNPLIVELLQVSNDVPDQAETVEETANSASSVDLEASKQAMLQQLRQAAAVLQSKGTPRELEAYREIVVEVAVKTAAATRSGGFLGLGGQRVDEKELALIGEIKDAVGFVD